MNRLVIATAATELPMGAQVYENEVASRAAEALAAEPGEWTIDRLVARSIRSPLAGTKRLPMGLLQSGGATLRRSIGRFVYPSGALVHRMGLTLPPGSREVVTMHDTVAWRFPDEGTPPTTAGDELRQAAAVVCVSQYTADEVAEMFGVERLFVTHLGVDQRFHDPVPLTAIELERLGIHGRFVLHAGGASRRKNLEGLAAAWRDVRDAVPGVSLVLAGPPHPRRDELFRDMNDVVRVGRLADTVVPRLMAAAEVVVVPSHHEGFGLPVLEAMSSGAPVVAARTSSLPEVAGDAALLVDPTPSAIAAGIRFALAPDFDRDGMVRAGRARAAQFRWEKTAAEHAEIWRAVADA